jgi:branched-chain amino acid transport system permease protein
MTALPIPNEAVAPASAAILRAEHITKRFGGLLAVDDVSFEIPERSIVSLIGPNGAGKTTFFNMLTGLYRPTEGRILFSGRNITRARPDIITARGVARTFQNIRLMDEASAAVNVALGVPRALASERMPRARQLLTEHDLAAIADVPAGDLPYGLRRRVEIARALARAPRLLLLDEPTAGMSPAEREEVFARVAAVAATGVAVVVVEHDVATMRAVCQRLLVLDFGQVIADGDPDPVLADKEVIRAYFGSAALA